MCPVCWQNQEKKLHRPCAYEQCPRSRSCDHARNDQQFKALNELSEDKRERLKVKFDIAYFVAIKKLPYTKYPHSQCEPIPSHYLRIAILFHLLDSFSILCKAIVLVLQSCFEHSCTCTSKVCNVYTCTSNTTPHPANCPGMSLTVPNLLLMSPVLHGRCYLALMSWKIWSPTKYLRRN